MYADSTDMFEEMDAIFDHLSNRINREFMIGGGGFSPIQSSPDDYLYATIGPDRVVMPPGPPATLSRRSSGTTVC